MFSRNFAALALVAGIAVVQIGMGAIAASSSKAAGIKPNTQTTLKAGPMTRSGNQTWQIVSLPLRLATGMTGLALGAIHGGVDGIVQTEEQFAQDTFGQAEENPLMVPVGLIGTIAALPVGLVKGAPEGAAQGIEVGYHLWDRF